MGTPDFSVPALEELAKVHQVAAVVTQQDRPKGRGHKMQYTPVKEKALELNIPVYQPEKVKNPEFVDILREINPDVIVVIAFGQILSKEILDLPKYGCINVHASLLPKYRGAAPIQWAVIDGEEETGVTTMYMAEGLDTGDVIDTAVIKLDEKETGGSLFDKLTIERLIRGLNPWPSAYTTLDGKAMKVWDATVEEGNVTEQPGEIVEIAKHYIKVATGENYLKINEIQLAGKKRMPMDAFLNGYTIKENILGL